MAHDMCLFLQLCIKVAKIRREIPDICLGAAQVSTESVERTTKRDVSNDLRVVKCGGKNEGDRVREWSVNRCQSKVAQRYRYHRYVSIFVDDANALGEHSSLRLPFYESQRNQLDLTGGQRSLLRIRHQQTLQFSGRFSSATAFFVRWRSGPASWWPILLTPVSMTKVRLRTRSTTGDFVLHPKNIERHKITRHPRPAAGMRRPAVASKLHSHHTKQSEAASQHKQSNNGHGNASNHPPRRRRWRKRRRRRRRRRPAARGDRVLVLPERRP